MSFFTVTSRGPHRVAPGLQTNSVWLESLCFVFVSALPATTDHASCRSPGGEMASAVTPSVWRKDQTPRGRGGEIGTLQQKWFTVGSSCFNHYH